MYAKTSNVSVATFRYRGLAWLVLFTFLWSLIPLVSFAQGVTATIADLSGTVLVNGEQQGKGAVLMAADMLQTQAGARVVLELADGSLLEIHENTQVQLADLSQTASGGRTSRVKMFWGRIRAMLSPGHQQADSSFEFETPNALVGVKFSQPDVEVRYDAQTQETTAFAITVALVVTNLLTGVQQLIPVGSTGVITAVGIQVISGIATSTAPIEAGTTAAKAAGMSGLTKAAIGVGALAAVGGIAVAAGGGSDGDDNDHSPSGSTSVEDAEMSDFIGQYRVTDPARSYDEWHATIQFFADMSFSYNECINGDCYDGSGRWSFDPNTLVLTMRTDGGAQFSGKISGTIENFVLSGTYADGSPATNIYVRI
ncbi:hypothetical protein GF339_04165 [candidate division KSB3 bacterium]|uniref:FecR protein domain-containing protein n=1 Tax=candidate division KSB3 bacterium TaxID=2044937 RepID=A0A9D5JT40_9BACT|nr:hypothetical protein [candidate division KSB3 bacterium]MBD3323754.1 hypothetical protein [candidate division KSB3 bacterium]